MNADQEAEAEGQNAAGDSVSWLLSPDSFLMRFQSMITAVDAHACGEPGRVITGGVLDVPGSTMFEKMKYFERHADHIRLRMLREPRGYPAANCNIILPPTVREADAYLAPRKATPGFGYGYFLWLFGGARRQFALRGFPGQRIYIDPVSKLILVQTGVGPTDEELWPLWAALSEQLG